MGLHGGEDDLTQVQPWCVPLEAGLPDGGADQKTKPGGAAQLFFTLSIPVSPALRYVL